MIYQMFLSYDHTILINAKINVKSMCFIQRAKKEFILMQNEVDCSENGSVQCNDHHVRYPLLSAMYESRSLSSCSREARGCRFVN